MNKAGDFFELQLQLCVTGEGFRRWSAHMAHQKISSSYISAETPSFFSYNYKAEALRIA